MQTEIIPQEQITEAKEFVVGVVRSYDEAISNACDRLFSVSAWFKAYTQSEEFAKLSNEFKGEAFDTYEDLMKMLNFLNDKTEILNSEG